VLPGLVVVFAGVVWLPAPGAVVVGAALPWAGAVDVGLAIVVVVAGVVLLEPPQPATSAAHAQMIAENVNGLNMLVFSAC
jgi:hypothetical protein